MPRSFCSTPLASVPANAAPTWLCQILNGADGSVCKLKRITVAQSDQAPAPNQNLTVQIARYTGSSLGAGGIGALVRALDPGSPAPSAAVNFGFTGSPGGSSAGVFASLAFLLAQGLDYVFPEPLEISGTQLLAFTLPAAALGAPNLAVTVFFDEEGGNGGAV